MVVVKDFKLHHDFSATFLYQGCLGTCRVYQPYPASTTGRAFSMRPSTTRVRPTPTTAAKGQQEDPETQKPAGRPKRPSADRRMRPGAGSSVSPQKRPKFLFLQCFTVGRAFLQPSRSVSRFSKSQSRGQRQHESAKQGGSEGSHCEPVYDLRLASSTRAGRASARERPFPTCISPLPRRQ